MKKRILALLLALCTLICALPVALAEETDAMDAALDALTSEAVEAEVGIAEETGAEGLVMDGDLEFSEETEADIGGDEADAANGVVDARPKGWLHTPSGWQYVYADGSYAMGSQMIDGDWYYFNWTTGIMHTGWRKSDDHWYYHYPNGVQVMGKTINIGGKLYTFDILGWWVPMEDDSDRYYGGWKRDAYGWWYQNADGTYPRNQWKFIDGAWYHFDPVGYMQTGWLKIDNCWYYLKGSGAMLTGWLKYNNKWYYMNSSGVMQVGRITVGGKGYYMDSTGAMLSDKWIKDGGDIYCYGSNGALQSSAKYYGNIYFLVDCYGSRIRYKVNPSLSYSDGWYLNKHYGCKCNSSGLIRSVILTDQSTASANYHLFGVRPGTTYSAAVASLQKYGFSVSYVSGNTVMFRSSKYTYPVYVSNSGAFVKSILYGSLNG